MKRYILLILFAIPLLALSNCYKTFHQATVPVVGVTLTPNGFKGVVGTLTVTVACPGSGQVFVSSEPLTKIDTQGVFRIAAIVAATVAGVPWNKCDYFYQIKTSSVIVGGPSAGLAATVATYAALTGQKPLPYVAGTGTINPDGTVGAVGGVYEKMVAAAKAGYKVFVIPYGERYVTRYKLVQEELPFLVVRKVIPQKVDLVEEGEKLGIKVVQVMTIYDALKVWVPKPPKIPPTTSPYLSDQVKKIMEGWVDKLLQYYKQYEYYSEEAYQYAQKAKEYASKGMYYEASSYAFTAAIIAEEAKYMRNRGLGALLELYKEASNEVNETLKVLEGFEPKYSDQLDVLVSAWLRYLISKVYLALAENTTNVAELIDYLVKAKYYAIASRLWLELFPVVKGAPLKSNIDEIANAFHSEALTALGYIAALGIQPQNLDVLEMMLRFSNNKYEMLASGIYVNSIATVLLYQNYGISPEVAMSKIVKAAELNLALAKAKGAEGVIPSIYILTATPDIYLYERASLHAALLNLVS